MMQIPRFFLREEFPGHKSELPVFGSGIRLQVFQNAGELVENSSYEEESDSAVAEKTDLGKPSLYRVILHNDDYTSMEFVVMILRTVFGKSVEEAVEIMYDVHRNGTGLAGIYTREIAETRVQLVHTKARENGFPLRCSMERD